MAAGTITISALMPVPSMRAAIVLIAQSRVDEALTAFQLKSTDKLRKLATIVRQLSQKRCFFCEAPRKSETKQELKSWDSFQICSCLATQVKGYYEYIPWQTNPEKVGTLLEQGKITVDTPVYSNTCMDCSTTFVVKAGKFVPGYKRTGRHNPFHLCTNCHRQRKEARAAPKQPRQAARSRRENSESPILADDRPLTDQLVGKVEKPHRRKHRRSTPLTATLAEQVAAKGEPTA